MAFLCLQEEVNKPTTRKSANRTTSIVNAKSHGGKADNDDPQRQTSAHQRLACVERVCPSGGVVFFQVDKLLRAKLDHLLNFSRSFCRRFLSSMKRHECCLRPLKDNRSLLICLDFINITLSSLKTLLYLQNSRESSNISFTCIVCFFVLFYLTSCFI